MIVLVVLGGVAAIVAAFARSSGDAPERVLDLASRRLPAERGEWRQAMLAELQTVPGRRARWRFAMGCARVALLPPLGPSAAPRAQRRVLAFCVATVAVLCTNMGLHLRGQSYEKSTSHGAAYEGLIWAIIAAVAGALAWSAARRLRSTSPGLTLARRYGVIGGLVAGGLVLAACCPGLVGAGDSDPLPLTPNGSLLLAALVVPLVVGVSASRVGGSARLGTESGWWAGVVAACVVVVGVLLATVFAAHWFTHDPSTIAAYHAYWPPPPGLHQIHYRNITAFVISANLITAAVVGVVMLPLLSYTAGAFGGLVGGHRHH